MPDSLKTKYVIFILKRRRNHLLNGSRFEYGTAPSHDPARRPDYLTQILKVFLPVLCRKNPNATGFLILAKTLFVFQRVRKFQRCVTKNVQNLIRAKRPVYQMRCYGGILPAAERYHHVINGILVRVSLNEAYRLFRYKVISLRVCRHESACMFIKIFIIYASSSILISVLNESYFVQGKFVKPCNRKLELFTIYHINSTSIPNGVFFKPMRII